MIQPLSEGGPIRLASPSDADEEVHAFVNELERPIGTYLYGRRVYQTMVYWENPPRIADQSPIFRDYTEIWQAADKVVFSRTLETLSSARTRIERAFDPDAVRRMKAAVDRDLTLGGPDLAALGFRAGLVDECYLFITPIVVGGGTQAIPNGLRLKPRGHSGRGPR